MARSPLAVLLACFGFGLIATPSASLASIVTVDFTALAQSGPLTGHLYTGSFSYDNSGLTGVGYESVNPTAYTLNFFGNYSLTDTNGSYIPVSFSNGALNSLGFLIETPGAGTVASGAPDSYISLNQNIPQFLYGYSSTGESFPPNGSCLDALGSCSNWEGHGTVTFSSPTVATPEPGGPIPVLAYVSAIGLFLWMRHRAKA
ncbi:MAG: hypothetical protein JO270_20620 [Acidobacteriaceae bacterium]|nr:hypothetical protein [Acidobacteriaceae bacterium]MBV8569375.1 hypothetical protein [Acidobacteriaceae bacterium]